MQYYDLSKRNILSHYNVNETGGPVLISVLSKCTRTHLFLVHIFEGSEQYNCAGIDEGKFDDKTEFNRLKPNTANRKQRQHHY